MPRLLRTAWRFLWGAAKVALLLASGAAVGLGALWLTVDSRFRQAEVVVPDIRSLSVEEAAEVLARVELGLSVEARRPHEVVPAGHVAYQDPPAGVGSRKKRVVKVVLSVGPQRIQIPDLAGQTQRQAAHVLQSAGLAVGTVARVHDRRAPPSTVLAQDPPPGSVVHERGHVDLLISLGAERRAYVMPDLRGRALDEVERVLAGVGMRLAEVRREVLRDLPPDHVDSQLPAPGTRVLPDTPVTVVVSQAVEAPARSRPGAPRGRR